MLTLVLKIAGLGKLRPSELTELPHARPELAKTLVLLAEGGLLDSPTFVYQLTTVVLGKADLAVAAAQDVVTIASDELLQ